MNFESQVKNSALVFQFTLAILYLGVSESNFDSIKLFSALNDKIIFRFINVFKVTNEIICKLM
jgi:hypothetical protein